MGGVEIRTGLFVHFLHRHRWDTMIILEEGNLPHPQFPRCEFLVPWEALNGSHTNTTQCTKGVDHKRQSLELEEIRAIT